jgi:hypothetical protein
VERNFQSSDRAEVLAYVREHGLKSTGLCEWSGVANGERVTVRLVSSREAAVMRLKSIFVSTDSGSNNQSVGSSIVKLFKGKDWF